MEKAVLFKVKKGQWKNWQNWCRELAGSLRAEALTSLAEEEVLHELALGFTLDDEQYVVGFMEGECLPANMDQEINQRHKEMKEQCLERVDEAEVLYNLKR